MNTPRIGSAKRLSYLSIACSILLPIAHARLVITCNFDIFPLLRVNYAKGTYKLQVIVKSRGAIINMN